MDSSERWLPVPGYEGRYEVSDLGRIKGLRCGGNRNESDGGRIKGGSVRSSPRILTGNALASDGRYRGVGLIDGTGRKRVFLLHRLVLLAFIGSPPLGHEASHLNGNGMDNRLSNLAWETKVENLARKREHGTLPHGEKNVNAKISWDDVGAIRRRYARGGIKQIELAREYGINQQNVSSIVLGKSWVR